jgi:copper chaperone CopZ
MRMKYLAIVVTCLVAVFIAGGYGLLTTRLLADTSLAMTELKVQNMTCGSCVATITEALESVDGIESIDVSVTTGRSKVVFNPDQIGAAKIAEMVTAVGFPAEVDQLLSADQYQALQSEETRLSVNYVARIGEKLIDRQDFEKEIARQLLASGVEDLPESRVRMIGQSWQALLQRTLLIQAAEENQVVVQNGEVDLRIEELQKSTLNLDKYVQSRYGSEDQFFQQLKEDMIINRNIEDHVLDQIKDPRQRQQHYSQWFQALIDNAAIVIYDEQLSQSASASGGCGGSCCG